MDGSQLPQPIPALGESITLEQATVLLELYCDVAGELAAGVAATLRDRGRIVHFWKVLSPDELVRTWDPGSSVAIIALTHYQPSQVIPIDAVQVRLDRSTGELVVWDGRRRLGRDTHSSSTTIHKPA
jgi:hypothetical protein